MQGVLRVHLLLWFIFGTYGYRESNDCRTNMPKVFDYIVVGAGAAGATIASRLTENPKIIVLLLEAGISDDAGGPETGLIETPRLWRSLLPGPVTWNYTTVKQKGLKGREFFAGMGKTLGGSTSHNALSIWRGFKSDWDYWASKGATGWNYTEVFPFFLKSENNISPYFKYSALHGTCGPLAVSNNLNTINTPLFRLFLSTIIETGMKIVDCNGPMPFGLCQPHFIIKGGKRQSTSVAFLRPAMGRKNLYVLTESQAEKILITKNGKRAYGVRYSTNGRVNYAKVRREVIISAGAYDTPKLLQLSGIGPRAILRKAKIRPLVNLPVGYNYQDHLLFRYELYLDIKTVTQGMLTDSKTLSEYVFRRKGLYANTNQALNIFYDILPEKRFKRPEIQAVFTDGNGNEGDGLRRNGTTALLFLLHPQSRGKVMIKSRDPTVPPLINPRLMENNVDVKTYILAIRKLQELTRTEAMKNVNAIGSISGTVPPECAHLDEDCDDQLECIIRHQTGKAFHPVGTCKMGRRGDPTTVVDPKLRVKGIKGLRVADASIMPEITSANTMGPCIMIGEKAADMIMKEYE